jgi:hypothetical protein
VTADDLARRLLDAQVAWTVGRLTGPGLADLVPDRVDSVLGVAARTTLGDAVAPDGIKALVHRLAGRVPPSAAASTFAAVVAGALHEGPDRPFSAGQVVDRDRVEAIVDELLARTDLLEAALDDLSRSPEVAGLAARFLGRIVQDVLQTNRAVAERIPGVGSLVSLGSNAAGLVTGVADKQIGQLVGGTAGKGATFAMRRLNKVLVETLRDPAARTALVGIYDLYADQPVDRRVVGDLADVERLAGIVQDIAIDALPSEPVLAFADRLVDRFLGVYGDLPAATLLEDLGITRDDVVAHVTAIAPRVLAAAHESGELERLVRAELEPFYASAEVRDILDGR